MNIEQLDETRILISLSENDIEKLEITFEELSLSKPHSRSVLKKLISQASDKTGIELSEKRLFIEALKYEHGFILLITLSEKEHTKKFRIKRYDNSYIFVFVSAEELLRCINALYRMKSRSFLSSVYWCGNKYYLEIKSNNTLHEKYLRTISEFSSARRRGSFYSSMLLEHGKLIYARNAVERIGTAFEQ